MRRCCVLGCQSNHKKPYVSVFQFPKSPGFRNLWLKRVGRPLLKVSENIGVCIKHFEKNCIVDYKDWKGDGGRKRITVKPGAVPTIFDHKENDSFSDDADATSNKDLQEVTANKQDRSSRSLFSDVSKRSDSASTDNSPKKMRPSPTTDKPFIAILKPEDSRTEETASCEEIDDDSSSDEDISKLSPNKANSDSPSPYKHFPTVTVCLKEEDRLNAQKELGKAVKRTASVSSNNSSGSAEVAKLQPKRRKIEKPAPTVLGKQNDCYCWVCHRENVVLSCIACPRAYHVKCAGDNVIASSEINDWVCPECKRILTAENVDTRSTVLSGISLDKLCTLLRFSLNKMKHRAGVAFHQPVSLEHYPMYPHYVIHPMDFSLLEKNIKQKLYGCTEAFLADVKWILHNSCVFNGSQHPLSTNAKSLVKTCDNDMQEIEVCPDCFMHSIVRNKYWFSEVCRKPHPLVWAKLKGFPYWPAKVVRIADGFVDARFFGAHDRAWVAISQCYHLSKEMPTSSKPKKKGNYEIALDELNVHVQLLIQKFGKFEYAPYRTIFDQNNKLLAYHGIDIDKIDKEEIPCDTSAVEGIEISASSRGNEVGSSFKCAKELSEDVERESITHIDVEHSRDNETKSAPASSLASETNLQKKTGDSKPVDKSVESASDSNQLNKIEMVLQRIKGYISTVDDDNEKVTKDTADLKESPCEDDLSEKVKEKEVPDATSKSSEDDSKNKETEEISILSGLIKSKTLPSIEIPTVSIDGDSEKDKAPVLDVVKKNDSFSLKLIETIESCKAKLGLSIESELDKIDSGDSESMDEDDENEEDEEDEDQEGEEDMSGDSGKCGKNDTSASDEESDELSESDEELNSHSSETDIETIDDTDGSLMKGIETEHHESVTDSLEETENKLASERDKAEKHSDAAAKLNVTEKSSPEKVAIKTHEQQSANESSTDIIDSDFPKESSEKTSLEDKEVEIHSTVSEKDASNTSEDVQRNKPESEAASLPEAFTPTDVDKDNSTMAVEKKAGNSFEQNKMEEDDDIFICPPVKPPTPPLICLDDGTETEPEGDEKPESDSNFKNSPAKIFPKQVSSENAAKLCSVFGITKLPTSARKSLKRVLKSPTYDEDSSDEDLRMPPFSHGVPLSGAKRTFNNRDKNKAGGMPKSPVSQTASNGTHQASEIRTGEQVSSGDEPNDENLNGIANILNKETEASAEDAIQNSVPECPENLAEKDAEIYNLKKKLSTLFSAFRLKFWKHNQEKAELRHNMNLIVMEMRASLEADKKQALETLSRTFEREKQRCIEETKKKQWCAYCYQESRYACCWNTSYCTVACQKRHFSEHKAFCTQLKRLTPAEGPESKTKSPSPNDGKENKKVFLLNVVSQADKSAQKEGVAQQVSVPKIIAPKAPVHLVSSSSSSTAPTVQLVLAPAKSDSSSGPLQPKLMATKLDSSESSESQNVLERKGFNSVPLLKHKTSEGSDMSEKDESKKEGTDLEEIYFPSPPGISFEGLDTALPDDNIQFTHLKDASDGHSSDAEQMANDKTEDSSAEEDVNWSDVDDTDNELVNIGRGVEILAKYLNKCLIYGQSAKKLTRCLIDVIFPDIKLLASCSAFGNKSNVTKLTRAALPARKVEAIIDFVLKRFPEATRSEIVLAINMKCKEARNIVGKTGSKGNEKKTLFRRLLAKEQSMDANLANGSNPSTSKPPTTITLVKESSMNVVCVPSTSLSEPTSSKKPILPKAATLAGPNIMRCSPQILIRPKSGLTPVGPRLLVSPSTKLVRDATKQILTSVRPFISGQKYGGKILVPIEVKKPAAVVNSSEPPSQQKKQRPYIIIGSPASTLTSGASAAEMNSEEDRAAALRIKRAEYMRNYRRAQRERQTDEEANQQRAAEALRQNALPSAKARK